MTGGLKLGVNVAAHTRHVFLGSAHPGHPILTGSVAKVSKNEKVNIKKRELSKNKNLYFLV